MPKKVNKDDNEWEVLPRGNSNCEICIIHYTKSTESLTRLPTIELWISLLDVAKIRHH